jgi:hypothetical protein
LLGHGDGLYAFEVVAVNSAGQREPQRRIAESSLLVDLADAIQSQLYLPLIADQVNTLAAEAPDQATKESRLK